MLNIIDKRRQPHTEEHKRKISETLRRIGSGKWNAGKRYSMTAEGSAVLRKRAVEGGFRFNRIGSKHRKESIELMKVSMRGLPKSPEHRKKLGDALRGRKLSMETRMKMSAALLGANHPRFIGGIIGRGGYVAVLTESYTYRREHRIVAERLLGRPLLSTEIVHHENHIKSDNRPENLIVFSSQSAHKRFEAGHYVGTEEILFDGRNYKETCGAV